MVRVPPSPLILKKKFSPAGNKPLKIKSRRVSNASDEDASPITNTLAAHDEEIVRESEPEDMDTEEWSGLGPVAEGNDGKATSTAAGNTTTSQRDQVVNDSFVAEDNDTGGEKLVEFMEQLPTHPIVSPPSKKRKRHERVSEHEMSSSSKHKKRRKSNDPPISSDIPHTSSLSHSQSAELPEANIPANDEESPRLSKKERKRKQLRRTKERKKKEKEQKKQEVEADNSGAVNPLDHDRERDEPLNTVTEVQATQEPPFQKERTELPNASPELELDEDSLNPGRPAVAKKNGHLEIPATQNPHQDSDRPPPIPSDIAPENEETPSEELPSVPPSRSKPPPKPTKRMPPPSSKPAPKRTRKISSNERILDSSASEEEQDAEPVPIPKTSVKRTKSKIVDTDAVHNTSADSEAGSTIALGKFSLEEDKRLLRVAKAYRVQTNMSTEDFAEKVMSRNFLRELDPDLKPEYWGGRRTAALKNRLRRLISLSENPRETGKGVYTPQENDIVDRTVKAFQRTRHLSDSELSAFLQEDLKLHLRKRQTEDMCRDLATKLPGRDNTSITRHLLNRYGETPTETWTPEDDATLLKLVAQFGKQWTMIADQMGRKPELVRLRYRDYVSLGNARTGGRWKMEEEKKLYETVLKSLESSEWGETDGLSLNVVSRYVNWGIISGKVGNRSPLQCRDKWGRLKYWDPLKNEKNSAEEGNAEHDGAEDGQEAEEVQEIRDPDV